MHNKKTLEENICQLYDQPRSFGWISIGLHWLSAALIISLWFIGQSISEQATGEIDARRNLHVTIAILAWLLMLVRIIWRVRWRHPHADGQSLLIHKTARTTHYLMLATLAVILASGPVLAWASGKAILILDEINFPVASVYKSQLANIAQALHSTAAGLLFALVILHILGALKHLMFNDDDTIVRMLWPKRY